ncbi:Hypothetical predicted protein, partial [Olea europaea subsp. europaea]
KLGKRPSTSQRDTTENVVDIQNAQTQQHFVQTQTSYLQYPRPTTFPLTQYSITTPFSLLVVLPSSNFIPSSSTNIMDSSQ